MTILKDKKILLGVTGGIAAYKAAEILRLLVTDGAEVRVVMTKNSCEFIGPQTMSTLSGQPVIIEMFGGGVDPEIDHIRVPESADVALVAPATANFLAKAANGIADDPLSAMMLVVKCPVLIAPAMNSNMYAHPAVKANIATLKKRGAILIEPEVGELACGYSGPGRLASPEDIVESVRSALKKKDLKKEKFLITAGPTREAIDPVRFVSNRSSGKMGYALAKAALRRGAKVTLITGPSALNPPRGAKVIYIESADDMLKAARKEFPESTTLLMAAAVADYTPESKSDKKIKRVKNKMTIDMAACPDIIATLAKKRKKNQFLIGFAAETDDLLKNAKKKLHSKNIDMIVANKVGTKDSGFDHDTNRIKIIDTSGKVEEHPLMTKSEAADIILDRVVKWRE